MIIILRIEGIQLRPPRFTSMDHPLPSELIVEIMTQLSPLDCYRWSMTCSYLHKIITPQNIVLALPHYKKIYDERQRIKRIAIRKRTNIKSKERRFRKILEHDIPMRVISIIQNHDISRLMSPEGGTIKANLRKDVKIEGMYYSNRQIYYALKLPNQGDEARKKLIDSFRNNLITVTDVNIKTNSNDYTLAISTKI